MSRHHELIKNDPRWKAAKQQCHERDGWACVECDETAGLQADHIVPLRDAPEQAFDVDNLQTLCRECHDEKEREYEKSKLVRNTWVNPRYPELASITGEKETETVVPSF